MNEELKNEPTPDAANASSGGTAPETRTAPPEGGGGAETEALQADIAALNDRLLRLQADFDNFRKRSQRERLELRRQIIEEVLADLLPVMDHFDMGLEAATRGGVSNGVRSGLEAVRAQFVETLKRWGVEEIEALGRPFDPHQHEAVAHEPSPEAAPDTVLRVLRKGYRMGDRLLRAAQVVVAAGAPEPSASKEGADA